MEDFYFILENYGEISGNQLFEGIEFEDLITDDFELSMASARLLGRQIKNITVGSPQLLNKLNQILVNSLQGFTEQEINSMYQARENGDKIIERFKLVSEVIKGFND